jgi:hypothetical protein
MYTRRAAGLAGRSWEAEPELMRWPRAGRRANAVLNLVIIGFAIILGPVRLVAFILILGTKEGARKGLAFIGAGSDGLAGRRGRL